MDTLIGQTPSHYRIVEKIGAGGMGEAYRAHDLRPACWDALGILLEYLASGPTALPHFQSRRPVREV